MTATCPKCNKQLKVKDEYAGRMLKCPACASTFKAGAAAAAPAGRPTAGATPPKPKFEKSQSGGVALNWGQLVTWGFFALIPAIILLVIFGPIRVYRTWTNDLQSKAYDDVRGVLDFALQCEASTSGLWNPNKSGNPPSLGDLRWEPSIFRMTVPPTVKFSGFTSNGNFEGVYTLATGEVEATLKIEGLTLPSGIHISDSGVQIAGGVGGSAPAGVPKAKVSGNAPIRITGRINNGTPVAELDGKPGKIYYPPQVDEDGNPI